MNYEEKYKEALERAKKVKHDIENIGCSMAPDILEVIFPELAESEDERIRRKMIEHFKAKTKETWCNMPVKDIIAYLEKQKDLTTENIYKHSRERMSFWNGQQKEQKPAEWTLPKDFEEAVYKVANFISPFDSQEELRKVSHRFAEQLMSLAKKELEKPAEWSEEDESELTAVIYCVSQAIKASKDENERNSLLSAKKWLQDKLSFRIKSLRPQPIQLKEAYKDGFQTARQATASTFMTYLDENRPEGKMCLSNSECEDIDKAFKEGDWAKIMRYVEKYRPSWKPSEEDIKMLEHIIGQYETGNKNSKVMGYLPRVEELDFLKKVLAKWKN